MPIAWSPGSLVPRLSPRLLSGRGESLGTRLVSRPLPHSALVIAVSWDQEQGYGSANEGSWAGSGDKAKITSKQREWVYVQGGNKGSWHMYVYVLVPIS